FCFRQKPKLIFIEKQRLTSLLTCAIFAFMNKNRKAKIENDPWNKDKAVGQMAPFTPDQAGLIRSLLVAEKKIRDLALFNMGIDTMLRASDLLPLRVIDVTDHNGDVVHEFTVRQKKTSKGHVVALTPDTRDSVADWMIASGKGPEDYLWTSIGNKPSVKHLSREQYANLVKNWCYLARMNPKTHSTHSVRRSKSAAIYDATHNLAACKELLGHKNIGSTAHYLGVDQRAALELAKRVKI
ncbi:MAG: tyrosine-type recombinase/integrase, partial [Nitrospira sp.]|nr:tyrosine-type recombinase/integrase [Nitrospira sp.]